MLIFAKVAAKFIANCFSAANDAEKTIGKLVNPSIIDPITSPIILKAAFNTGL